MPTGWKAIGCKWVFKEKFDNIGNSHCYKARLVAKGFSQKYGKDYDETFAPVVRHETIRTLFSVAAAKKMEIRHFDVKMAFLHKDLEEDIFMDQPPVFSRRGRSH